MLSINNQRKHRQYLERLPWLVQSADEVRFLYSPGEFRRFLLEKIASASQRICLVALYLEQDEAGQAIMSALYQAKRRNPALDIRILVDWHRAQRGRIGEAHSLTNADWYYALALNSGRPLSQQVPLRTASCAASEAGSDQQHGWQHCSLSDQQPGFTLPPEQQIPVYGVPVNTREALGVLHFKGFIIDDGILYSGASINDIYLQQQDKYRYDRYQWIGNRRLADLSWQWLEDNLLQGSAVHRLDSPQRPGSLEIKNDIRQFRQQLRYAAYAFRGDYRADHVIQPRDETMESRRYGKANRRVNCDVAGGVNSSTARLTVTPLVGLGKNNPLNQSIAHLFACTRQKLTLCTPYFNLPAVLTRRIIWLLRAGKQVEIIVGDKTANDFYIPEDRPFRVIGALPYLYEINLRRFLSRLQYYLDQQQLTVRLWKHDDNSYHLKGVWVDEDWLLLTGNNLNPRAWRLDLENAILIHDPRQQLAAQRNKELQHIRTHTRIIRHYQQLQSIADYPVKVRKLIRRIRRIRLDRLINRIL